MRSIKEVLPGLMFHVKHKERTMTTHTLAGYVTTHEDTISHIRETVSKLDRHQANVAYYTSLENFAGWCLMDYSYDIDGNVTSHQVHEQVAKPQH